MVETSEQAQLRALLQDPRNRSYLTTRKTGEHYLVSGMHTDTLYQLAPWCGERENRQRIVRIFVSEWRGRPLHADLDVLIGVGSVGLMLAMEMQADPEFVSVRKVMLLDRVVDPSTRTRLNMRRAKIFTRDTDPRRSEYVLGRNLAVECGKRVGLVIGVVRTGNSISAAFDACADPHGGDMYSEEEPQDVAVESVFAAVDCPWEGIRPSLSERMSTVTVVPALCDPLPMWKRPDCPHCRRLVPLAANELVRSYL